MTTTEHHTAGHERDPKDDAADHEDDDRDPADEDHHAKRRNAREHPEQWAAVPAATLRVTEVHESLAAGVSSVGMSEL